MNNQTLDSKVCRNLQLPLAIMVVFLHSFGLPSDVDIAGIDYTSLTGLDFYNLIRVICSRLLSNCAVPAFFIISGYYFFYDINSLGNNHKSYFIGKWRKRLYSLLIPYLVWNTIYILYTFFIRIAGVIIKGKSLSSIYDWISEYGNFFSLYWNCTSWSATIPNIFGSYEGFTSPLLFPMWFIRDLIVVVLIAPLLYFILKKYPLATVFSLVICYTLSINFNVPGLSIISITFFAVGASIAIHRKSLIQILSMPAIKISAYCMSVISLIVSIVIFEQGLLYQIVYKIFCLFGTISLFNILASLLAHNKYRDYKLTKFSGASFFIFAMHIFVLGIIVPVLNFAYFFLFEGNILTVVGGKKLLAFVSTLSNVTGYFVIPTLTVILCIGTYILLKRLLPDSIFRILNGGR